MPVKLCDSPHLIADAINNFSPSYQAGYFRCRAIGRRYLAEATPANDLVTELGDSVRSTLRDWGAGKREAPELRSVGEFSSALREPRIHSSLVGLSGVPLPELTVVEKHRWLSGKPAADEALGSFDFNLLSVLRALSGRLFVGNTNVTFPMKVVLLLTGLMPALDSRVRTGLKHGGFAGMNKTQYLLPDDAAHADGKKITCLPFLLGQCWTTYAQQLQEGIANSSFPGLREEPGRVFDILLFMQGGEDCPILVTCDPRDGDWYKLR